MDVHKNYLQIAVLNENGKVLDNSRVDNDLSKIAKFFDRLDHNGIVMESSGLWYNICEYLTKKHFDVRLSNPTKTRAIASAKIKTDKLDAIKLVDLKRDGYFTECYIPNKRIMELRDIVRHRAALVLELN
jgi:transposase